MSIQWEAVERFAHTLQVNQGGIDQAFQQYTQIIEIVCSSNHDHAILQLGELFSFLNDGKGEQWGLSTLLIRMNEEVIQAAIRLEKIEMAARFLHHQGQSYHRQGLHQKAIISFNKSALYYHQATNLMASIKSTYMTALCHRALGNKAKARQILQEVLQEVKDQIWRANPLIILAWLERDNRNFRIAMALLDEALLLLKDQEESSYRLIYAQTLVDLAEIQGKQKKYALAEQTFAEALGLLQLFEVIDQRQLARTYLKMGRLKRYQGQYNAALKHLKKAEVILQGVQEYRELRSQIQLEWAITDLLLWHPYKSVKHLLWMNRHLQQTEIRISYLLKIAFQ